MNAIDVTRGRYWDVSVSPVTGCTPTGAGCDHCWARAMIRRFPQHHATLPVDAEEPPPQGLEDCYTEPTPEPFESPLYHPHVLTRLGKLRRPRVVAMSWLGDLFHESLRAETITEFLGLCHMTTPHTYLVLTKRPARMMATIGKPLANPRWWWGASAWDGPSTAEALACLSTLGDEGYQTWLSLEPLLGPVNLGKMLAIYRPPKLQVIVGGETGAGARPMAEEWVCRVRDDCTAHGVPFFFKAWGTASASLRYRVLNGRTHDDLAWKELGK